MANEVSLRKVNVSAVPLLKPCNSQLESFSKRSDVQSCVKECARGVRDRMQRATRICRYFLCSTLFRVGGKIKSLLIAYGVPCGFLDLDCDSHPIDKNANTLRKSKTTIWSVFETKTFESDTRSIIEKHRSDLLAVSERNVDLKRFSPAGDCWSCASVAGDGTENDQCSMNFTNIWHNPSVLRSLLSCSVSRQ